MRDEVLKALVDRIFEAKRLRRAELAGLPIERKLEILLDLQRIANQIASATGRPTLPEWPPDTVPGFRTPGSAPATTKSIDR